MMAAIVKFFSCEAWEVIANFFTAIGVISPLLSIAQYFHNSKVKEWKGNVTIRDYENDYDVENIERNVIYSKIVKDDSDYSSIIVFCPVDCVVRKLEVIQLDSEGKEVSIVEAFKNLTPESPVCFRTERAECIPSYKIRWYIDYGEYCEYEFSENGRNGITDINGSFYKNNIQSNVRKAFGFR